MLSLSNENKNTVFLAFNKKINNILKNKDNLNILGEKNYNLIDNTGISVNNTSSLTFVVFSIRRLPLLELSFENHLKFHHS